MEQYEKDEPKKLLDEQQRYYKTLVQAEVDKNRQLQKEMKSTQRELKKELESWKEKAKNE